MNRTLTPVALALAFAFSAAQAQSIIDGSSNTLIAPSKPGSTAGGNLRQIGIGLGDGSVRGISGAASLTTVGFSEGDINQTSQASGTGTQSQTVSIGGARNLSASTGTIQAVGAFGSGTLTQTRNGAAGDSAAAQTIAIGSVSGALAASSVDVNGTVIGSVTQTAAGSAGSQSLDVGGVADARGGSLRTNAESDATITQTQATALTQEVAIGSLVRSNLQLGSTQATTSGSITQTGSVGLGSTTGGLQRLDVASISDVQAQTVSTSGQLSGTVVQGQRGGARQTFALGAVSNIAGATSITTDATSEAKVTQNSTGNGTQELLVGSVRGGAPTTATTFAFLSGEVFQNSAGQRDNNQRIAIGAAENASGRIATAASSTGKLTQIAGSNAASRQSIEIGSVIGGAGN